MHKQLVAVCIASTIGTIQQMSHVSSLQKPDMHVTPYDRGSVCALVNGGFMRAHNRLKCLLDDKVNTASQLDLMQEDSGCFFARGSRYDRLTA